MNEHGPLLLSHRKLGIDKRLKIGLVLPGQRVPSWVHDLLAFLRGVPQFDLVLFAAPPVRAQAQPAPSWLADRLYTLSKRKSNPFEDRELELNGSGPALQQASCESLAGSGLDMLVWLAESALPGGSCKGLARFGMFTIQLGDGQMLPPYWDEVIKGEAVSPSAVFWHASSFNRARAARSAETATQQGWFFTRNAEEPLAAASRMLAALALELINDGPGWMQRALRLPELEWSPPPKPVAYPSTMETLRFAGNQARRTLKLRAEARLRRGRWFVGVRRNPAMFYSNLGRFTPLEIEDFPCAPGSAMADPFVVADQGRTWLFFEEIPAGSHKGRLSCRQIGTGPFTAAEPQVILEREYHLSYPCVFQDRGEYFMIPETSLDRTVELHRATRFPFEFRLESKLIEDLSVVDTTPFLHDGRWYFFTTTTAAEPFMETLLFWSETLGGKWHLHPASPISSSVRNIRAAGHLFYHNRRLLRPTQDCSVRYGYGIVINEVTRLTATEFEEQRVDFIGPDWRRGLVATHTLNATPGFEVIDGVRYDG